MSDTTDDGRDALGWDPIEEARALVFKSLLEDAGEARGISDHRDPDAATEELANKWFAEMVVKAFAQHFQTNDRLPDTADVARTAAKTNQALESVGSAFRLVLVAGLPKGYRQALGAG